MATCTAARGGGLGDDVCAGDVDNRMAAEEATSRQRGRRGGSGVEVTNRDGNVDACDRNGRG